MARGNRRQRSRPSVDLSNSALIDIGDGFYVDPSSGLVLTAHGYVNGPGYVVATRGGKGLLAHRVIWEAVHGPIPEGLTINHINGVKTDNRIENLELATQSEQLLHAYRLGLQPRRKPGIQGEKHHQAKLTEEEVRLIRATPRGHNNILRLSQELGVSVTHIYRIRARKVWTATV